MQLFASGPDYWPPDRVVLVTEPPAQVNQREPRTAVTAAVGGESA